MRCRFDANHAPLNVPPSSPIRGQNRPTTLPQAKWSWARALLRWCPEFGIQRPAARAQRLPRSGRPPPRLWSRVLVGPAPAAQGKFRRDSLWQAAPVAALETGRLRREERPVLPANETARFPSIAHADRIGGSMRIVATSSEGAN